MQWRGGGRTNAVTVLPGMRAVKEPEGQQTQGLLLLNSQPGEQDVRCLVLSRVGPL